MNRPVYEGVEDATGSPRRCWCGDLASYDVKFAFADDTVRSYDTCNVHFRQLSRVSNPRLRLGNEFPEYTMHIQRMRVWMKKNA